MFVKLRKSVLMTVLDESSAPKVWNIVRLPAGLIVEVSETTGEQGEDAYYSIIDIPDATGLKTTDGRPLSQFKEAALSAIMESSEIYRLSPLELLADQAE